MCRGQDQVENSGDIAKGEDRCSERAGAGPKIEREWRERLQEVNLRQGGHERDETGAGLPQTGPTTTRTSGRRTCG